jgi:hypothetical protein
MRCRTAPREGGGDRKHEQRPETRMPHDHESSGRDEFPNRHNFITLLCVVSSDGKATLRRGLMGQLFMHRKRHHRHSGVRTYVLLPRLGVPYEVERTVCSECRLVLDERPLKRAVA